MFKIRKKEIEKITKEISNDISFLIKPAYSIIGNKYFFKNEISAVYFAVNFLKIDNPKIFKKRVNNNFIFIFEK